MAPVTLHLRSETKPLEHRSALTPTVTRKLLDNGFNVNIERSPERIFDDKEFASVGATLVEEGSWPNAPEDHIIIGLKELEDKDPFPLKHTHVAFSHCYKNQGDWEKVLGRFPRGGGTLYDLEFLADEKGRRVAAFGFHAGYAGAALALLDWAWQLEHGNKEALPGKGHYQCKSDLDTEVKEQVSKGVQRNKGKSPRVLVIGALGRCGRGALECCRQAGIPEQQLVKWDMDETAQPGPYNAIKEADAFINCIYLSEPLPPFISTDFLKQGTRNLSVVCDVSCDTTNPHNPIPFANQPTYFSKPTITLPDFLNPPLSYISIDHLPSLLPREASEAFSEALLSSLLQLPERDTAPVWVGAEKMFKEKVALLPQALRQRETPVANGAAKA
ncbi:hypothetical protein HO173_012815 [Letharia columbiana]|uniref:Saccharopine dehydrogenase [NAD(+), L-lysine-forming] n=1 Tax=Letharia columbiana TaxID=112416 RepID=A0A8H6CKJ6_9LECA|nr:uncharacterized protein HO173_012815 [Letharia columbiana]KAF6225330.1 hypothetical protein HO173_012815 [Letharia columbiana]